MGLHRNGGGLSEFDVGSSTFNLEVVHLILNSIIKRIA